MAWNAQKLNDWIRGHKLFALALPIAILLLVYFLTAGLDSIRDSFPRERTGDGYNNSLPGQSNELEIKDPNTYYKETIKDSLERLGRKNDIGTIVGGKKENDSLERILKDLEMFSLGKNNDISDTEMPTLENHMVPNAKVPRSSELSETEKRIEYRTMLQRARQESKAGSQDFSAPNRDISQNSPFLASVRAKATVYRDQFIVPGSRVTLILREDLRIAEHIFPKNTFVYATVNIQGSRLLLDIANIGNYPISLRAYDQEDGRLGIYNERAGELLSEFYSDVQEGAVEDISRELSDGMDLPMTENAIRAFGKFFSNKKRKDRDEILLINGYKVFLKT